MSSSSKFRSSSSAAAAAAASLTSKRPVAKPQPSIDKPDHGQRVRMSRRLAQINRYAAELNRSGYETLFVAIKRTGRRIIRGMASPLFDRMWHHAGARKAFRSSFAELNLRGRSHELRDMPGGVRARPPAPNKKEEPRRRRRRRRSTIGALNEDESAAARRSIEKKINGGIKRSHH